MTAEERTELEALQEFAGQFGVSELTDSEFDRYMALLKLERAS